MVYRFLQARRIRQRWGEGVELREISGASWTERAGNFRFGSSQDDCWRLNVIPLALPLPGLGLIIIYLSF